jgi:hypothetical protein
MTLDKVHIGKGRARLESHERARQVSHLIHLNDFPSLVKQGRRSAGAKSSVKCSGSRNFPASHGFRN